MANFQPARAKLTIGSLDKPDLTVKADYNPKELQISKQLSWKPHNEQDRNVLAGRHAAKNQQDSIEVTGAPKRSMVVELLFDGYETNSSIEKTIARLDELSSPQFPTRATSKERRPHYCVVVWGQRGIPAFRCVIDKLDVKYTMFDTDGVPLRAICTVTLTEANIKLATADGAETRVFNQSMYDGSRAIRTFPRNTQPAPTEGPATKPGAAPVAGPPKPASPTSPVVVGPAPAPPSATGRAEAMKLFREVNDAPRAPQPPSSAGRAEAMEMFREVNGDVPRAPQPPSAAGRAEAMELFREVNDDDLEP